jgi:hypothetical protein
MRLVLLLSCRGVAAVVVWLLLCCDPLKTRIYLIYPHLIRIYPHLSALYPLCPHLGRNFFTILRWKGTLYVLIVGLLTI